MTRHIAFCLDEIEAEIEALDMSVLHETVRSTLAGHIAGMRIALERATSGVVADDARSSDDGKLFEPSDDLTLIRGIGPADAALLAHNGVRTFTAIAAWRREDILALGGGKALLQRISGEGWIEQASVLASGKETHHIASRFARSSELALSAALALASTGIEPASIGSPLSELDPTARRAVPKDEATPLSAPAARQAQPASRSRLRPFVRAAAIALLALGLGTIDFSTVMSQVNLAAASQSLDIQ